MFLLKLRFRQAQPPFAVIGKVFILVLLRVQKHQTNDAPALKRRRFTV